MAGMGLTSSVFAPALALALRRPLATVFRYLRPGATFPGFVALHAGVTVAMAFAMGGSAMVLMWAVLLGGAVAYWGPVVREGPSMMPAARCLYLFAACPLLDMAALYPISTGDEPGGLAMIVGMVPLGLTAVWSIWTWAQWEERCTGPIAPAPPPSYPRLLAASSLPLSGRRLAQILLGCLWLTDGMLQLQPCMFVPGAFHQMLVSGPPAPPDWLRPLFASIASLLDGHGAAFNAAFGFLQLALGVGLLWPRFVRPALAASVVWGIGVWFFGEVVGGLLSAGPSALAGAPGAALLYAVVAVLVWPTNAKGAGAGDVAGVALARDGARLEAGPLAWALLWTGTALLEAEPAARASGRLAGQFLGAAQGGPAWLVALCRWAAVPAAQHPVMTVAVMAALQGAVGAAIWSPRWRRAGLALGLGLAAAYGLVGQGLGGIFAGTATDPGTAPIIAIMVVAIWPEPAATPARSLPARVGRQFGEHGVADADRERARAAGAAVATAARHEPRRDVAWGRVVG